MANETKIINKPKVTVDGDVSIDDSTPISTNATIQGTPNVAVTGNVVIDDSVPVNTTGTITGSVATNATIQGTPNVAVTGNVAIDDSTPIDTAVTGTVSTNATIQGTPDVKIQNSVTVSDNIVPITVQGSAPSDTVSVSGLGPYGEVETVITEVDESVTVTTKGKTSYSDTTTDPDYWLGLYNDNQLIKKAVEISAGEIITTATFQSTAVDTANGALQITEFLDGSSNVTGRNSQVVTWTQANADLALPNITDIDISDLTVSAIAVAGTLIGTLSATGATGSVVWTIETNASSLANIEIDGANLKVASGGITSIAGSYILNIKGTDSLGKVRAEDFTIEVTSSYTNSKYINNGNWLRSFVKIKDIAGELNTSNAIVRSDKAWTINIWVKTGTTTSATSQSWSDDSRSVWSCNKGDWALGSSTGTGNHGLYLSIYMDKVIFYTKANGTFRLAQFTTALDDTSWYMITVTNTPVSTLGDTWYFDIEENAAYTAGLTVYINGSRDARAAYHADSSDNQSITSNKFMLGCGPGSNLCKNMYWDEFSIHNTTKTSSEVAAMYNSGSSTDLSSDSSAKVWINANNLTTGETGVADGVKVANSGGTYEAEIECLQTAESGYTDVQVVEY